MHLKCLEMQGFKSFPERIRLEFDRGITAIVGPNGSGKSNVSDAIRWVLGEQSAKSLRGAKMEDVIFNGTQNRRPLGFAEVSMTIDNSDGRMNIPYAEVTATRRVYRSGESQYLLNRQSCRLRDIQELFMDTGLGREGYSIIGQGRVDEILSAKSDERRYLFDEAAGIVKYKNRKAETESRLERERQNLLRAEDFIAELESRLEPLSQQAERAKAYLMLCERQKLLRVNIFLLEIARTESDMAGMDRNLDDIGAEIAANAAAQENVAQSAAGLREESERVDALIDERGNALTDTRALADRKRGDIQLIQRNIEHMESDIRRLAGDVETKTEALRHSDAEKEGFAAKRQASGLELAARNKQLELCQAEFNALDEVLAQGRETVDRYTAEHIEKLGRDAELKSLVERTELIYTQMEERLESLNDEIQYNQIRLKEIDTKRLALEQNINEKNIRTESLASDTLALGEDRDALNAQIGEDKTALARSDRELKDAGARLKLLSELEASYEGYYKSVKTVLREKRRSPSAFRGLRGAVAELLRVAPEHETAVEVALGAAMQNIVTDTEEDAKQAIAFLKREQAGRATFLPLSAVKPKRLNNRERLLAHSGIRGSLKDFIEYAPEYENIFSSLLERVILADNIDDAIAFARATGHEYKVVTQAGDLLNPGGSLTGGSLQRGDAGILSRAREIEKLKHRVAELTPICENLQSSLDAERRKRDGILLIIEQNKMRIQELELAKATLSADLSRTAADQISRQSKTAALERDQTLMMERLVETNKELREHKERREELEREIAEILRTVDEKQTGLKEYAAAREAKTRELTHIRVEISGLTENMNAVDANIARLERDALRFREEIENIGRETEDLELSCEAGREDILAAEEELCRLARQNADIQNEIARLREGREGVLASLRDADDRRVACIERAAALGAEQSRLEMRKDQIETDIRRLYDEMWDDYGITKRSAQDFERLDAPPRELRREERELTESIRALGSVNTAAIEEYASLRERHGFLVKQRDDIIEAEHKLREIIGELSGLMEAQFNEQFSLISDSFGIVFAEMFGGGRAHLRLLDEDNALSSGIEIVAQPPGKSLQNMNLFSGGERALIATALLFAILRLKPSPFCVLDEIEAALDDANVRRYANFLKNFAADTQFIVITHRKGTMEAADVLYGVTMQEQGVSTLVGVKFDEAS